MSKSSKLSYPFVSDFLLSFTKISYSFATSFPSIISFIALSNSLLTIFDFIIFDFYLYNV